MKLRKWQGLLLGMFLMSVGSGHAQGAQKIHWVFRNYYTGENAEKVEVWLSLGDGEDLEFIGFDPGAANEVPGSNHPVVDTWWAGHGHRYQAVVEDGILKVLTQGISTSQTDSGHLVVSPQLVEVKKIPVSTKALLFEPSQTQTATEMFTRVLSVQKPRLYGDDVWTLQRLLVEQQLLEPSDIDGWYGPDTENAVKRFQNAHQLPNDGIVGSMTWNALTEPDEPPEGD